MAIPPIDDLTQATDPTKTAGRTRYDATCRALPDSRAGHVIYWLRGVSRDSRIGVLHRLALIGIGLHRRSGFEAIASAIGVDRACILRAADIGIRRGWLASGRDGRGYVLCGGPRKPHAACETRP